MGKGKQWTALECKHVAEAWVEVSEDQDQGEVKGANQTGEVFWSRVYLRFISKGPTEQQEGTYGGRGEKAVRNYWTDNISRDCKKFNKSLMKVYQSRPTGVSLEEKINIAVALFLKKADTASSRHKDFPTRDWKFFDAWLVLKGHRAFIPPTPEQQENAIELDDDNEDEEATGEDEEGDNHTSPSDMSTSGNERRELFVVTSTKKSRGPGAGAKKTKKEAEEAQYRRKKTKLQEEIVELATQRQKSFDMFVHNNAKKSAFDMAMNGFNAFKESDPERAEQYKKQLDLIMFGEDDTRGDD